MFQEFHVGTLFQEGVTRYKDGVKFDVDDNGTALYIFIHDPEKHEIENIRVGKLDIGLYVEDEVIFLAFKFFHMATMDSPYTVKLSNGLSVLPEIKDGEGLSLMIFLVDASTGILRAMRVIGLTTKFSRSLKAAIEHQAKLPFERNVFDFKLRNIMRLNTPDQIYARSQETCSIKQVIMD